MKLACCAPAVRCCLRSSGGSIALKSSNEGRILKSIFVVGVVA